MKEVMIQYPEKGDAVKLANGNRGVVIDNASCEPYVRWNGQEYVNRDCVLVNEYVTETNIVDRTIPRECVD